MIPLLPGTLRPFSLSNHTGQTTLVVCWVNVLQGFVEGDYDDIFLVSTDISDVLSKLEAASGKLLRLGLGKLAHTVAPEPCSL